MAGANAGVNQAVNAAQAVAVPDERPPSQEEAEVFRRLVREFRDQSNVPMLQFAKQGEDRFPSTYIEVQSYVSRLYRYIELGVLIEAGPVGMVSKLREIGWEGGLGHVDGECSSMAWVRPLIPREAASTMAFAKLQGGDWYRCVDTETMSSARGNSEVPYSKLDCFGGVGTTPCTIARVSQNLMNRVATRSAGRDRALAFTSVPVRPAPGGVEHDDDGNLVLRDQGKGKGKGKAMAVAARGKGKGKGKGMRLVRIRAKGKAKAKARAMR